MDAREVMEIAERLGKKDVVLNLLAISQQTIKFAKKRMEIAYKLALETVNDLKKYDKEIADKYKYIVNNLIENSEWEGYNHKNGMYYDWLIDSTQELFGQVINKILNLGL